MKRGQVTIFIILAIVIVAAVAIFFLIKGNILNLGDSSKELALSAEAMEVKVYVEECLEESLESTLFINGIQGGYFVIEENYLLKTFEEFPSSVPYYISDGINFFPSEEVLMGQLLLGVKDSFNFCLTLNEFPFMVDYNLEEIILSVNSEGNKIIVDLNLPTRINVGNNTEIINSFSSNVESFYFEYYHLAKEINDEQMKHLGEVCITCNSIFANIYGLEINTFELEDGENYFILYYLNYGFDENVKSFFNFAHKFDLGDLE